MKLLLQLLLQKISLYIFFPLIFLALPGRVTAQKVSVTATAGTLSAGYATLKAAFNAVNAGTHHGVITIKINSSTLEGTVAATLNGSGAGAANYTSITISPSADGVTVSGNPGTGYGVIQLKGADNVTIDGDNANTSGTNRNLTILNTGNSSASYSSVIRLATSTAVTSCDNNTIKNCILTGSSSNNNSSIDNSLTGSENTTFGIYVGGNGGSTLTNAVAAITSVINNTSAAGETYNSLLINNNTVNECARAIVINGSATANSSGVVISNNIIGDQLINVTGNPPYTSPATTVYVKGISVSGTNSITVTGNSIKNIMSYVPTTIAGIELNAAIGAGIAIISGNTISGVIQNNSADTNKISGIAVYNAGNTYSVSANMVSNIQGWGGSLNAQTAGIFLSTNAASGLVESNTVTKVYNRNTGTWGVQGINLAAGNNITVQNNFVSDINEDYTGGSTLSSTFGAAGIKITGGTGHMVYHNSVNLYGSTLGNTGANNISAAFVINSTSRKNMVVENNIFSNSIAGGTTSIAHVSVALPAAASSAMNLTWNNNIYYCGPSVTSQGIAQVGGTAGTGFYLPANFNASATTPANNFRTYTSSLNASGTNDNASYASANTPPFTSSSDLHINILSTENINAESKGANAGVLTDIDGESRVTTTPDIGADEFSPTAGIDMAVTGLANPSITSCHSNSENVTVTIKNASAALIDFSVNPITVTVNVTGQVTETLSQIINTGSLAANAAQDIIVGQVNTTSTGTYNFAYQVSINVGTDMVPSNNAANTFLINTPLAAAANASPDILCGSGSSMLSVSASGGNGVYTYLWNDGTNVNAATNSTGIISTSNSYTVSVMDGCLSTTTAAAAVTVNNPLILSTTPAARCGAGSLVLGAEANAGTTVNWYATSSGGPVIATGINFTTPVLTTATTYYVSALSNVNTIPGARISPATTSATLFTDAGLVFDVNSAFTLNSVDVYPNNVTATIFSIALVNSSGTLLFSSAEQKAPSANGTTAYTVPLGWSLSAGTGYRLIITGDASGKLVRETVGFAPNFPYLLGAAGSITSGWFGGISAAYYFFYNWNISTGCETARMPVIATIVNAPAISTTGSATAICTGSSATLSVNSSNDPSYTYTWMPGNLSGASIIVAPTASTNYIVNAVDNTNGINAGCTIAANVNVAVAPLPGTVNISPGSLNVCSGSTSLITGSTNGPTNSTILSENFNGNVPSWTKSNSGSSPSAANWQYEPTPYSDPDGSATFTNFTTTNGGKFAFSDADAGGQNTTTDTKLISPSFSTAGYISASVAFENLYRRWSGDITVALEISTNGGSSWSVLKDYKALGSQGNTTDDSQTITNEIVSLSAYLNQPNLKLRFNYKTEWGYYWIVDNLVISGIPNSSNITWSPVAGLFTDANAISPYTGGFSNTVYAKPGLTTNYTVTATNPANCSSSNTILVTVNPGATVNAGNNQTICSNGTVSLSGTIGGTATSASWSSSGSGTFANANNLSTVYTPSTADKTNGSVILTLTTNDPPGLCNAASAAVAITIAPALTVSVTQGTIACNGGTTTVTITGVGGTPPYNGTGTFTVSAGAFSKTITDALGCSRTLVGNIPQPPVLTISASQGAAINCNGGTTTITVTATGGTSPYSGTGTFTVPAGSYSYTVTDNNGCTKATTITVTEPPALIAASGSGTIACNGGTTTVVVSASGGTGPYTGTGSFIVGAGAYSYTVTDAKGCTANTSGTILEPAPLAASSNAAPINCNGGTTTIEVSASGGTEPYTGPGSFIVGAGPYSYTVTDANGCTSTTSGNISEPTVLTASSTAGIINCNGATTTVTVSADGGTGPYNGTGEFTVGAGSYNFIVTDANGCTTSTSGSISEPSLLTASSTTGTITCSGGTTTVTVSAEGGTGPYNGTGEFTVGAGSYNFTVTDANGCTSITSGSIIAPALLTASSGAGLIACNGGTTTVTVTADGGTGPYTGTGSFVVGAGSYSYPVTDANGCTAGTNITITQPDNIAIGFTKTDVSCFGGNNGKISLLASGGTPPYSYSYNGGASFQASATNSLLTAGSYQVVIQDVNGCTKQKDGLITVNQSSTVLAATACYTIATNSLHAVGTGGTAPYKYSLNGTSYVASNSPDGGIDATVLPGTYTAYVKDKTNCIYRKTIKTNTLPACNLSAVIIKSGVDASGNISKANRVLLELKVAPNPSETFFTLTISSNSNASVQMRVMDMYGKVLFAAHGSVHDTYHFGDKFLSGGYILEVIQASEKRTIKIVKG